MFVSRTAGRLTSPHTISKVARVGSVGIATAALTAGFITTATPASAETATVKLNLKGVTSSVSTSADTVRQLLTEESVSFDKTDLVSPSLSSDVVNGMTVSWTPARRIVVKRDGDKTRHRVVGSTVQEVRQELSLPTATTRRYARFETRRYTATRFYSANGRRLHADDIVRDDAVARVYDVRVAFADGHKRIKPKVVKDRSKLVRSGSRRVYKQGRAGKARVVFRKVFLDGELDSKRVVESRTVRDPKRKVVRIGTGPNWVGLARCESGRNPNAVNPAGFYGLYQFSLSTWHAVGGKGNPTDYGYWEQTKRAWILFKGSGRSPWPVCGRYL
ncbi:MAG TPA: transglycosylase family protein [Actinomycetes bacterium]|nr:transglycosylase family protein [Actinomycetes bacterium]